MSSRHGPNLRWIQTGQIESKAAVNYRSFDHTNEGESALPSERSDEREWRDELSITARRAWQEMQGRCTSMHSVGQDGEWYLQRAIKGATGKEGAAGSFDGGGNALESER